MAAVPNNVFRPDELADVQDVEKLETEAPAEQPEPQPEPAPAPAEPEKQAGPPHEEHVPYDRFKALNEYNRNLEQELAQHREFRLRLDERRRVLDEANARAQQTAEQQRYLSDRPDPALDPVGAELWDLRQLRTQDHSTIEQLQSQLSQWNQNIQTGQENAQFTNWVTQQANDYYQQDPSYPNAAKYAADKRVAFWRAVAPNAPQGLAEKMVEGESLLIARLAQQYGGQFAPALANLAREWGFSPQPQQNGNGGMPPQPRQYAPQTAQRQAQLNQIANGQRMQGLGAVPTGGNAGGATAYRNYSAVDIANMSEREFMQCMSNAQTARDLRYAMSRAEGLDEEVGF
jgi:hypothetical protein